MGITLSSPYKNGTLSSIATGANGANTRLNTSGITWASGDVGRQVYFYNGDANRESREIIAQGANFCDISFPFGEYPVLKPDGTEVPSNAPSAGNFMGVSYYLDEIDDGSTLIKQTTDFYNHPGGSGNDWTIANGVMVYDVRKTLRISPGWIDLDGILQLGNIDVNGNPINSCGLIGTTTSQGGFGGAGNSVQASSDFGALRMFGGFVSLTATGGTPFWRMHQTGSNSGGPTVFHNINFDGRMGGRIDGEKSYFLNCRFSRLNTTAGPINPESDVAMLQNLNVLSGTQVVYHFWPQSLSTTIPGIRFDPDGITSRFTRMAGSTSLPFVLTLDDVLVDDLQALQDNAIDLFVQDTSSTAAHTVTLKNPLTVNTQNSTSGFRLRITDGAGSEVYNDVSDGSGDWAKATYDWGSLAVAATTVATYDLTDFVEDGPYTCVTRKYNKLQQSFTFDARAPQITTIPDVNDTTIVEAAEATVAAYTELENLDKLRDRWKEEYTTDFDLDDLIAGATGFATPDNCENIVLDKAAGSAFSFNSSTDTATIKTDSTGLVVGSTYSSLSLATGGSLTVTADEEINGLTITGDVNLGSVQNLSNLVVNGALDFSTAGTYNLTSCTITEVTNSSGGNVTVVLDQNSTVTTNTGPNIAIEGPFVDISITGMPTAGANIRLQLSNETAKTASAWAGAAAYSAGDKVLRSTGVGSEQTAGLYFVATTAGTSGGGEPTWDTTVGNTTADGTVIWTCYSILYYNDDPASASYADTYIDGEEFSTGDSYRIRFAEMNGSTSFKTFAQDGIVSASGIVVNIAVVNDSIYATNAVDGSSTAVTNKFTPDFANNEIDLDTNTDFAGTEAYAYYCYELTQPVGMYQFWDGFTALDEATYRINSSIVNLFFDETAGFVKQTDSVRIYRDDGTRPAKDPTTGGNGLEINWRNPVYGYDVGGGGFTSGDRATLNAASTQATVSTIGTNVDSILADTNELQADWVDGGRLDLILDALSTYDPETDIIEGSLTYQESQRIMLSEASGKVLIFGDTVVFRDLADTKNRIAAKMDANGQRLLVILDGT